MFKEPVITAEDFALLLSWLDSDRNEASLKYERLRRSLTIYFMKRGVALPEDLVDVTINRVTARIRELVHTFSGDPALYFYGVARNVRKEYQRYESAQVTHVVISPEQTPEHVYQCLESCVERLPSGERDLLLSYYGEEDAGSAEFRIELAKRLGISLNLLRVRIHRLREKMRECISECCERVSAAQPS